MKLDHKTESALFDILGDLLVASANRGTPDDLEEIARKIAHEMGIPPCPSCGHAPGPAGRAEVYGCSFCGGPES